MAYTEEIIGGMFGNEGLNFSPQPPPPFLQQAHLRLINARSGIRLLCNLSRPKKVWLPSFLCNSITSAIPKHTEISFYPVDGRLKTHDLKWVKHINKKDLVIFIDYFGFPSDTTSLQAVSERGATILQDASQALLSTFERPYADFTLYSPRKTVGVPDGGILTSHKNHGFSDVRLQEAPADFIMASYKAYDLKTRFDQFGKINWYDSYQAAEELHPLGSYKMTDYSYALLKGGFDYKSIAKARRQRYKQLLNDLSDWAIFKELPEEVVPLGFPLITNKREQVLEQMYRSRIFCPVHWPIDNRVPKHFTESQHLSDQIMTILCDQRLSDTGLKKMTQIFISSQG
ncbi:hypothetical protein HW115_14430 [Verrucomicrobiaceae bacterium N1E253]|uniref:Aminotransferase n=1 Tax=Oceaniferula marina TaxID=2748318 RepID=A0A851GHI4_9BACT|nr:DegT/DnrJ/EryC1/StrS family aminotransferase [Oceaniferula marina]NWK56816.1 hypothetical protein [Oceaniferula marina]